MTVSAPGQNISYTRGGAPSLGTDNGDGTFTVRSGHSVTGKTYDEILAIVAETWPQTWVWDEATDPNCFINSVTC
ncbi:hypothetical protein CYLTODRAFT_425877 [Cylindrobasidium torrendii FP15055 ss-10]|uniref:Uncharacterized protein n=1 Tax=Cylindrobasidium torrendii FP15055 ss-10 TaxID=1314674 RepID=A0A0D7B0N7_9AGAR|nr:hypothetical protein CYLTODRAFT_425877 [Cylindrobasidium torrendii FP15055 ss-10]